MNKRQKKKNAKNAMINIIEDEATEKDWHVVMTYGREYFCSETGFPPELFELDLTEVFKAIRKAFNAIRKAFSAMLKALGDMCIAIAENMDFKDEEVTE